MFRGSLTVFFFYWSKSTEGGGGWTLNSLKRFFLHFYLPWTGTKEKYYFLVHTRCPTEKFTFFWVIFLWSLISLRESPVLEMNQWISPFKKLKSKERWQAKYFCRLVYPQPLIGCLSINIARWCQSSDQSEARIPTRLSLPNALAPAPGLQQLIRFQCNNKLQKFRLTFVLCRKFAFRENKEMKHYLCF